MVYLCIHTCYRSKHTIWNRASLKCYLATYVCSVDQTAKNKETGYELWEIHQKEVGVIIVYAWIHK